MTEEPLDLLPGISGVALALVLVWAVVSCCESPLPGHARLVAAPTAACAGGLPLVVAGEGEGE